MTIGLAIITKAWTKELDDKVALIAHNFDHVYIQLNGDPEVDKSIDTATTKIKRSHITFSRYKWNDSFADARNALHKEIKTDYWVWMDTDDDLKGLDSLRDTVKAMERTGVEILYCPYHYEIKQGKTVVLQYRERIIKTSVKGKWMGRLHETFVPDRSVVYDKSTDIQWIHDKDEASYKASKARNLKILEEEANKPNPDPRDLHYLALAYFGEEMWEQAIAAARAYIRVGGWDEEIYRSWTLIAKCQLELKQYEQAVASAMAGTRLLPEYPDAYYYLQDIYYFMGEYGHSLEWFKVAQSKPTPDTNSPLDPTVRAYRANFSAAMSYSMLGKVKESFELMEKVGKVAPDSPEFKEFWPDIRAMYYESEAIIRAEWLASYYSDHGGNPDALYKSLPPAIQQYPQVLQMIRKYTKPKTWPTKSIVFFCGPGLEEWGPDTLHKGMGGSEEAVTYLSRELAKLGWQVTVFNERKEEYFDAQVPVIGGHVIRYLPWQDFNPNDTFDVFVAWRNPKLPRQAKIKARKVLLDMHDTPVGHQVIKPEDLEYVDHVMLKSQFQKDWAEHVPDDKAVIVSNGIVKEQFNV